MIEKLKHSKLNDAWQAYCTLHRVDVIHTQQEGYLRIHTRKRRIDPGRVSQLNENIRFRIDQPVRDPQNTYIKGE
ncbi:MAG: hypothetical protein ACI32N_03280 [Bulleidia sp.]